MRSALIALLLVLLVPIARGGEFAKWYEVNGGTWEVSRSVVDEIASGIQTAAQKAASLRGKKSPSLATYAIQYQGVQPNGKQVEIRGTCKAKEETRLKNSWVIVFDGGDCYFHAFYDVEKKKFTQFVFNGEA